MELPELINQVTAAVVETMRAQAAAPPDSPAPQPPERIRPKAQPRVQFLEDLPDYIHPATAFDATGTPKSPNRRRDLLIYSTAAAVAILALLVYSSVRFKNSGAATIPAPLPPPAARPHVPLLQSTKESLFLTLNSFSRATSNEERLKFVLRPAEVAPQMTAYYLNLPASHEETRLAEATMTPLAVDAMASTCGVAAARLDLPGGEPRLLFFKRRPGPGDEPYLLDWESYIQEVDQTLEDFVAKQNRQPETFRVRLSRTHDFALGLDEHDLALTLRPMVGKPFSELVVVKYGTPLFQRLDEQLKWDRTPFATVDLEWTPTDPANPAAPPTLTISKFICWDVLGVGRRPEEAPVLVGN